MPTSERRMDAGTRWIWRSRSPGLGMKWIPIRMPGTSAQAMPQISTHSILGDITEATREMNPACAQAD